MDYVLVWGIGLSGRSSVKWLHKHGHQVAVYDDNWTNDKIEFLHEVLGQDFIIPDFNERLLSKIDYVIVSPGVSIWHDKYQLMKRLGIRITTDIGVFLENYQGKTIGITGTNGKSTLTAKIAYIANKNACLAKVAGNIGQPCLDLLDEPLQLVVLELSSFHLAHGFKQDLDLAILINIAKDHLNWHKSFMHYKFCKQRIMRYAKASISLVNDDVDIWLALSDYFNWQDTSIEGFAKLPHRLQEFQKDNQTWVNDSKATNAHATLYACKYYANKSIILIMAGQSKGWQNERLPHNVKQVILVGCPSDWAVDFTGIKLNVVENLSSAILLARSLLVQGDFVLFSPGGASFDYFDNFEQRGDYFMSQVRCLD